MLQAEVHFRRSQHLSRILTSFCMLEKKQLLTCKYFEEHDEPITHSHKALLEVQIDGKRIAFDLADRSALHTSSARGYLDTVDFYFERSHEDWSQHPAYTDCYHKIKPYGLDFYTACPGNPVIKKPSSFTGKVKHGLKTILGENRYTYADAFVGHADRKDGDLKILFMSRLWDPEEISISLDLSEEARGYREYLIAERYKINQDRIDLVRHLREKYGEDFIGGIQRCPLSQKLCPDLVLPDFLTRKATYLRTMKKADICIGSAGLHRSIGWKTGEYVAAARAIVCETPVYLLPGQFSAGMNFLPYNNVSECIEAVDTLYHSPEKVYQMKCANEQYYRQYMQPETQLLNALSQCGILL